MGTGTNAIRELLEISHPPQPIEEQNHKIKCRTHRDPVPGCLRGETRDMERGEGT